MNMFVLDTLCQVLDLAILAENLGKMQASADAVCKILCPHAKSHKCSTLAKRQIEIGAMGMCVAKVSEAEILINAGAQGVLITGAVAVAPKDARLARFLRKASFFSARVIA